MPKSYSGPPKKVARADKLLSFGKRPHKTLIPPCLRAPCSSAHHITSEYFQSFTKWVHVQALKRRKTIWVQPCCSTLSVSLENFKSQGHTAQAIKLPVPDITYAAGFIDLMIFFKGLQKNRQQIFDEQMYLPLVSVKHRELMTSTNHNFEPPANIYQFRSRPQLSQANKSQGDPSFHLKKDSSHSKFKRSSRLDQKLSKPLPLDSPDKKQPK
jgi:hypothetical protein